ncbi:MAG: hypothetical protein NTY03_04365 [Candidatus Bathyarchaeota archaeon]|nr:hypothetical protein [Candidatus Bathyarchaeota archaeon]
MSRIESKPRLDRIRAKAYREDPDLDDLVLDFKEWSTYKEYLIFRIENRYTLEKKWKAVQASKRGNKIYSLRLKKRLSHLYDIPEVKKFNYKDRSSRQTSNILMVTLTYSRDRQLYFAWDQCGKDENRFMASMRKKYGDISIIRSFEAQRDGFPHIHLLLYFREVEFETFHFGGMWRVHDKKEIEDRWRWGFVDVQAVSSLHSGISYVVKYLNKVHLSIVEVGSDSKMVLTLAMLSIFRKRAFSISGSFKSIIGKPTKRLLVQQFDLLGQPVYRWFLVGFWGGDLKVISKDLSYLEFFKIRSSASFNENRYLC